MDVQVAEAGSCRRTLTFSIPADDLRSQLDGMFKEAAQQVRMKGFRPGKVPRKVLEKQLGAQLRNDAKQRVVSTALNDAVRQHELAVVGTPRVDGIDAGPLDESQNLEFTVELDVRPEFELGDIAAIRIDGQPTEATDEDVDRALKQLAEQKRTLEEVDEPVDDGDFLECDVTWLAEDGSEVLSKKGQKLSPAIPFAGTDAEAYKNSLLSKVKGDTIEVALTFADGFEVEEQRGKPGKAKITIQQVQRFQHAPIDDELAKGFDIETLDEMKDQLRQRIGEEKVRAEHGRQEEAILEILADQHAFDLPASLVEDQLKGNLKQFAERLQQDGKSETEVQAEVEAAKEEAGKSAERTVRMFFLLDAIARKEEIRIDAALVRAEMQLIAEANGVQLAQVEEHFRSEEGRMQDLSLHLMEREVRKRLREKAQISDNGEASAPAEA